MCLEPTRCRNGASAKTRGLSGDPLAYAYAFPHPPTDPTERPTDRANGIGVGVSGGGGGGIGGVIAMGPFLSTDGDQVP